MKILKFYTPTCMPCKIVGKILEKMGLEVEEIDATEDLEKVDLYRVFSTPTLIFLNDEDKEVGRTTGPVSESKIREMISK